MTGNAHQTPAQIRASLKHPVIDGDGHWVEYDPVFAEKMRKVGGDKAADGFLAAMGSTETALDMSVARSASAAVLPCPDSGPAKRSNTLDRATAMMPRLFYDRMDEFGADFAIVYPTAGLRLPRIQDDETRRAVIHAYNIVSSEYFQRLSRSHDAGGNHPDASSGRSDRRTRICD